MSVKYGVVAGGKYVSKETQALAWSYRFETANRFAGAVGGHVVDAEQLESGNIVILTKPIQEKTGRRRVSPPIQGGICEQFNCES